MSWLAQSKGTIKVTDIDKADKVIDILNSSGCFEDAGAYEYADIITVVGESDYDEEALKEVYKEITPYIERAVIEFVGEDNSLWKHEFENGQWNEASGHISYEEDEILIF